MRVVFPAPLGPIIEYVLPLQKETEKLSIIFLEAKVLWTFLRLNIPFYLIFNNSWFTCGSPKLF